jgi:hypothetical protein
MSLKEFTKVLDRVLPSREELERRENEYQAQQVLKPSAGRNGRSSLPLPTTNQAIRITFAS